NAPDVLADPILIEQVLLNLLKNGLEAMEKSESDELKVAVILHDQHIEVAVERARRPGRPHPY
ncbi:PAS domain-containing sensor histidine kinase, partial [Methylobacterium radiotolerans]